MSKHKKYTIYTSITEKSELDLISSINREKDYLVLLQKRLEGLTAINAIADEKERSKAEKHLNDDTVICQFRHQPEFFRISRSHATDLPDLLVQAKVPA